MKTTRRSFVTKSLIAAAGVSAGFSSSASSLGRNEYPGDTALLPVTKDPDAFSLSIFSKHLQWLDYKEMAQIVAEMGFDGVDLTVRPGGHVLPEKVESDLPLAVEAIHKAGRRVHMITTSINNADDPLSEKILKTASSLGIRHYRMGYGHYNDNLSVEENISENQKKISKLARLNEKYGISGDYQNHSGVAREGIYFGAAIWDLATILKNINSPLLGSQYDIYHAIIEGANTWPVGMKLISPFIKSIDIKDFQWSKNNGKWESETVPLGEGMVDFKRYFGLIKKFGINVPISVHYEYPLGGAEHGDNKLSVSRETVISAISADLATLKRYLKEAGLV